MRKMPVNSLAVKGQLGVLCPLQGCHSFHYRSISHKDEYEIRIAWSNNILSIYINIVSSDNVFWSKTFFVDSNLSVPPASEIIIKRRKHSQRRRPERGRTCDHILTWHSYTTHTHTQTQKHALTQVRVCRSRSMMHQVSASFIISLLTRYPWGCVLIVTFYLFTFCCLFFQFFLVVSKFQVLKPRA